MSFDGAIFEDFNGTVGWREVGVGAITDTATDNLFNAGDVPEGFEDMNLTDAFESDTFGDDRGADEDFNDGAIVIGFGVVDITEFFTLGLREAFIEDYEGALGGWGV